MEDLVDLHITPRGWGEIDFDKLKKAKIINTEKRMKIELTNDEINFIQQVLGELPSKTGAFLVMNSIAKQVQEAQQFEQVKQSAIQGEQNV
jgi:hypothetical protein